MASRPTITSPGKNPSSMFDLDYSSSELRLQVIGVGFLFYAVFFLICHILSAMLCRTYRTLPAREKVGVGVGVCGYILLLVSTTVKLFHI